MYKVNEIDYKLNERLKMFDDIDKMILNDKNPKQNLKQEKRMFIGDISSYKSNQEPASTDRIKQPTQKHFEQKISKISDGTSNHNDKSPKNYQKDRAQNNNVSPLRRNKEKLQNNYIPKNISKGLSSSKQVQDDFSNKVMDNLRIKPQLNSAIEINYPMKSNEKLLDVMNNFSYNNYFNSNQHNKTLDEFNTSPDRNASNSAMTKQTNIASSKVKNSSNKDQYNTSSNINQMKRNISNINLKNDYPSENTSHSPSNIGNKSIDNSSYLGVLERGERIKKKWEQKKEKSIDRSSFTPEITSKAKQLSRDPMKFPERLYPVQKLKIKNESEGLNNLIKSPSSSVLNVDDTSTDDKTQKIYFKQKEISIQSNYNHQPKLDKNSLLMAKKLGDPKERLLRKKTRSKTPVQEVKLSNENQSKLSKSPTGTSNNGKNHCINLYEKGQYNLKVRNDLIQKKAKQEESSYLKYSFHPTILSKSRSKSKSSEKLPLYDRLYQWDKVRNNKKERIKELNFNTEKENCTFHPNIEENRVCDDEAFINKNLQHIMSYIARKQKVKEKKKEEEKLYKKRFGYGENYVVKKTVPKEFNLSGNNHKQQSSQDLIAKNHQQYLQDFGRIRSKLKTEEFFDRQINLTTDNDIFDENEGIYNNDHSNLDKHQLAMAVNYLHQQLHND